VGEVKKKELEKKKVVELRALAKELGIKLKARRKAEIIDELIKKTPRKKRKPAKKKAVERPLIKKTDKPVSLRAKARERALVKKAQTPLEPVKELSVAGDIDRVTALTVSPWQIFTYWELTERTVRKGTITLRVYDVTGVDFDGENALSFFDIKMSKRVGSAYIDVVPGREFIVDIGVLSPEGTFMPARRSNRVSTPPGAPQKEKAILPAEYFEFYPGREPMPTS
jgi:hypothetical protein